MRAHFDLLTVFFYLVLGLVSYILVTRMMRPANSVPYRGATGKSSQQHGAFLLFIFLFTFFATFRMVTGEIGGADALNYVRNFNTILTGSALEIDIGRDLEPGFQLFTKIIRHITSDYHIYFLIVYGFICYAYLRFIRANCPKGLIYTPFILIMYLYLRSFNTMRTSFAISFVLIGLTLMDKKKWLSLLFIVASVFIHRISIMFVPVWIYYYLFNNRLNNLSRVKFVLITGVGIVLLYLTALQIQSLIGITIDLEENDIYYATHNMGENHFERFPLVMGHLLLYGALVFFYDRIKWDGQSVFLRTLFIYDFFMVPIGVVFGVWRFVEYFYLVRLSLWSIIIYSIACRKSKDNRKIIYLASLVLFGAWLYYRIYKEWDQAYISPYILDMF